MRRHDHGLRSNPPRFSSQDVYDELERLVSLAKEEISQLLPLEEQLEKLIALFYGDWGFKASRGVYRLSDALWLDRVKESTGQCGIIRCGFIMGRESSRFAAAAGDFPYAAGYCALNVRMAKFG